MNLQNTPMRVFKEARRKGDTATMERAMGYVGEFSDKADEYKAEADKGMEEDAREVGEKAKLQHEEAIRKRREEREKILYRQNPKSQEHWLKSMLLTFSSFQFSFSVPQPRVAKQRTRVYYKI